MRMTLALRRRNAGGARQEGAEQRGVRVRSWWVAGGGMPTALGMEGDLDRVFLVSWCKPQPASGVQMVLVQEAWGADGAYPKNKLPKPPAICTKISQKNPTPNLAK